MSADLSAALAAHEPMIQAEARRYRVAGMDHDDLAQEAREACWRAIEQYDPARGASLATFARMVVRRRLIVLMIEANRIKRQSMRLTRPIAPDGTVSMSGGAFVGEADELSPIQIEDRSPSTPEVVIERERLGALLAWLPDGLTDVERRAVGASLNGVPYSGDKQLDNALQRARRKIDAFLTRHDAGLVGA